MSQRIRFSGCKPCLGKRSCEKSRQKREIVSKQLVRLHHGLLSPARIRNYLGYWESHSSCVICGVGR